MTVVGVDCATVNQRTGLAFGSFEPNGVLTVEECFVAKPRERVAAQIHSGLSDASSALLALDTPLGWPAPFAALLSEHRAGRAFPVEADRLFRRWTDEVIRERIGKAPLEVAANFLARTAVASLQMLQEVSQLSGAEVPLAWRKPEEGTIAAIEVYPAGTLRAYQKMGYVSSIGRTEQIKHALLKKLQQDGRLSFAAGVSKAISNEHVLDAVLCCVAGLDFLEGKGMAPGVQDTELVLREGWIWVRDPDT
jgi:predicted RNase H-like nuclease